MSSLKRRSKDHACTLYGDGTRRPGLPAPARLIALPARPLTSSTPAAPTAAARKAWAPASGISAR